MTAFNLTKAGALFDTTKPAYYTCIIDTSSVANWPWTVTLYASTDHTEGAGGISMYGAVGDPTVPENWESYNEALVANRFDSFATKPAANPIYVDADDDQTETPFVNQIGGDFYLTYHNPIVTGVQQTKLAKATGAPLNFTRVLDNAGIVLDNFPSVYPTGKENHTGYFRWGINPFSGIAYNYIGYSLFTGGDSGSYCLWGSDDAQTWSVVQLLGKNYLDSLPAGDTIKWPEIDPASIRDSGNGEYVGLASGGISVSGSATRTSDLYEIYLASDGFTHTREPRIILGRGGVGSPDEYELGTPSTLIYNGTLLCVYMGTNSSEGNSIMLATGSVVPTATKPNPIAFPNHTKQIFNAMGASALPSWLTTDAGTITFSAAGMKIDSGKGIAYATDVVQANTDWMDLRFKNSTTSSTASSTWVFQFSSSGPGSGPYGLIASSYGSVGDIGAVSFKSEINDVAYDDAIAEYVLVGSTITAERNQRNRKHHVGLRWKPSTDEFCFIGPGNTIGYRGSAPNAPANNVRPRLSCLSTGYWVIEQVEVRLAAASGGVAPTISSATVDSTTAITFALSEDCLGDGTGIAVNVGGSPVIGTWSRAGFTSLTFTRSSGIFSSGDTITYAVSSTDIRNAEDLVAVQDVPAAVVTNTLTGGTGTWAIMGADVSEVNGRSIDSLSQVNGLARYDQTVFIRID